MIAIFFVEKGLDAAKDILGLGGNSPSKQRLILRSKSEFGLSGKGNVLVIGGSDAALKLVAELLAGLAQLFEDGEKEAIAAKASADKENPIRGSVSVFAVDDQNLEKVRDIVGIGKSSLERQSVVIRSGDALGKTGGNYIYIDGTAEACSLARKLLVGKAREVKGKDAEEIAASIRREEDAATEGFGGIFG